MKRAVLLRGINLGPHNRVSMPELRRRLADAGYEAVQTLLQSGNIVLNSGSSEADLVAELQQHMTAWFGLDLRVLSRTGTELAEVVALNPFKAVVEEPRRYQVSFLSAPLAPEVLERLHALAGPSERVEAHGREVYAWHPDGVARSKLWNELAGTRLGVAASARNWTTVSKLAELTQG